jgi:hypothetical protein
MGVSGDNQPDAQAIKWVWQLLSSCRRAGSDCDLFFSGSDLGSAAAAGKQSCMEVLVDILL